MSVALCILLVKAVNRRLEVGLEAMARAFAKILTEIDGLDREDLR
ncbi:MAG: hypothetical protein VYE73_12835 [Acidobacteriota bacterium]|nr:hypothetical protein [Acidobacteriota bacterium]